LARDEEAGVLVADGRFGRFCGATPTKGCCVSRVGVRFESQFS